MWVVETRHEPKQSYPITQFDWSMLSQEGVYIYIYVCVCVCSDEVCNEDWIQEKVKQKEEIRWITNKLDILMRPVIEQDIKKLLSEMSRFQFKIQVQGADKGVGVDTEVGG